MPAYNETQPTLHIQPAVEANPGDENGLVMRAQTGEVAAIRELYLCHHELIYRFLWSRVHDPDLADDLTGEVFIRMIKALPDYQDRALPFRSWLYGIARNLAIDHYRKAGPPATLPLRLIEGRPSGDESLEEQADLSLSIEQVFQALEQLDADEREVVELRFLAGLSLKETAETIGKTVAAVKAIQHRGLAALKMSINTSKEGA